MSDDQNIHAAMDADDPKFAIQNENCSDNSTKVFAEENDEGFFNLHHSYSNAIEAAITQWIANLNTDCITEDQNNKCENNTDNENTNPIQQEERNETQEYSPENQNTSTKCDTRHEPENTKKNAISSHLQPLSENTKENEVEYTTDESTLILTNTSSTDVVRYQTEKSELFSVSGLLSQEYSKRTADIDVGELDREEDVYLMSHIAYNNKIEFQISNTDNLTEEISNLNEDKKEGTSSCISQISNFQNVQSNTDNFHEDEETCRTTELFAHDSNRIRTNDLEIEEIFIDDECNNSSVIEVEEINASTNSSERNNCTNSTITKDNHKTREKVKRRQLFAKPSKSKWTAFNLKRTASSHLSKRARLRNAKIKSYKNQSKTLENSLQTHICTTLKDFYPQLRLTTDAFQKTEMFLRDIVHRLGREAASLVALSHKKIVNLRVLKYAIKLCLEHIKNEIDIAAGRKNKWML
ncbi:protein kinase 4-like [Stegodyphus dumicola]|uniref:protein kinase 4-like n=1 Tax=Stegodyphus dumicola TaxID=202533 RepID=UPI0015A77D00|nr:protein kinase 4-like [Stegodyphus dumicola]